MINSFFGFQILQLGMMGTSVIISSGDRGVAGVRHDYSGELCQDSTRMSLGPLKAILLCFDICV